MDTSYAIITIIAALLSGAIATIITICVNKKYETRKNKLDLVNQIIGYRYQLYTPLHQGRAEIYSALCRIPIVFNDNSAVMFAFNEFIVNVRNAGTTEEMARSERKKEALIRSLCEAVNLKYEKWETDNFKNLIR